MLLGLTVAATAAFASPASAQEWRCHASALDTVAAGGLDRACGSDQAAVPGAIAATAFSGGQALAAGGVTDFKVSSLPSLPIPLPAVTVPDSLGAVSVPLPSVPGVPLPASIDVDLRPAVNALIPARTLPSLDLLEVDGAIAYAIGRCSGGAPSLEGFPQVSGVRIAGAEVPAGEAVTQVVTLLPAGTIDTATLDPDLVVIPSVPGIPDATLRPIVEAALAPLLAGLPDLSVPAALAEVQLTPASQTRAGHTLTQRALHAKVSILGMTIADSQLGVATVSGDRADCRAPQTVSEAALACTKRKLVLTDVVARRGRVRLVGAADRSLVGRRVRLVLAATGRTVARAVVREDGSFRTTAPLPRRSIRFTDLARYRAVLGRERSLNLKLMRRMVVTDTLVAGNRITISGRVLGTLARPRAPIVVKRRTSCTRMEVVKTIRPNRRGHFTVSFRAPQGQLAPVYRLQTRVRFRPDSRRTNPTFTLPRAISVG